MEWAFNQRVLVGRAVSQLVGGAEKATLGPTVLAVRGGGGRMCCVHFTLSPSPFAPQRACVRLTARDRGGRDVGLHIAPKQQHPPTRPCLIPPGPNDPFERLTARTPPPPPQIPLQRPPLQFPQGSWWPMHIVPLVNESINWEGWVSGGRGAGHSACDMHLRRKRQIVDRRWVERGPSRRSLFFLALPAFFALSPLLLGHFYPPPPDAHFPNTHTHTHSLTPAFLPLHIPHPTMPPPSLLNFQGPPLPCAALPPQTPNSADRGRVCEQVDGT